MVGERRIAPRNPLLNACGSQRLARRDLDRMPRRALHAEPGALVGECSIPVV